MSGSRLAVIQSDCDVGVKSPHTQIGVGQLPLIYKSNTISSISNGPLLKILL